MPFNQISASTIFNYRAVTTNALKSTEPPKILEDERTFSLESGKLIFPPYPVSSPSIIQITHFYLLSYFARQFIA